MKAELAIALMFTAAVVWGVVAYYREKKRRQKLAELNRAEQTRRQGPHRRRAAPPGVGSADAQAASLLRQLLAGTIGAADARARWPSGVSVPTAVTYLDYFEEGLDRQGMRDPGFDKVVAGLADHLERHSS